jgi:Domain of unknown function (DUF4402)
LSQVYRDLSKGLVVGTKFSIWTKRLALLLALVASLQSGQALAATKASDAKVVVVSALSFLTVQDLDFGDIVAAPTAGTVIVAPTGVRTKTGAVTLVTGSGNEQPARFAGRGTRLQTVLIKLQASPTTLTRISGTETMILDTLVIGSSPTVVLTTSPQAFTITSPTGIFNFPVGGTLHVNANQVPGDYLGTFTIDLQYQ